MSIPTPAITDLASPIEGDVVQTTAGVRIGRVATVSPTEFQLTVGDKTRWVSREAIFTAYDGHVTLVCEAEGLLLYTILD